MKRRSKGVLMYVFWAAGLLLFIVELFILGAWIGYGFICG